MRCREMGSSICWSDISCFFGLFLGVILFCFLVYLISWFLVFLGGGFLFGLGYNRKFKQCDDDFALWLDG